jgi:hypothetical protein
MSTPVWLDLEAAKVAPPADEQERTRIYLANASRLPWLDLRNHVGQWVALRWDGLAVLAAHEDSAAIDAALATHGIDPESVLFQYVPRDDEPVIEHGSQLEIVA